MDYGVAIIFSVLAIVGLLAGQRGLRRVRLALDDIWHDR